MVSSSTAVSSNVHILGAHVDAIFQRQQENIEIHNIVREK